MKFSRDNLIGAGVLLAFILVASIAAIQKSKGIDIPYLSTSSSPNGTLALKLWLNELGYQSAEMPSTAFTPDKNIKAIFVIQPLVLITDGEWKLIDSWVEQGGTLVLAGDNGQTDLVMDHFEFSMTYVQSSITEISATSPIFDSPLIASKVAVKTSFGINSARTDFTPLMSTDNIPVIVSFKQGKGMVILSSAPYIFSNLALKNDENSKLILNILALTGKKGDVWFDEWHHGFQSKGVVGPTQWLQFTPGGHAILFITGVIFIALFLRGRAFGRPIPLRHEIKKRGPLEHVTAIANLNRRAGHRDEVLKQYHQRIRRHFGQRYRLAPDLSDADYVTLLAQYNSAIDKDALLNLLNRLSQKNISEAELLKLASETARWIND